MHRNIISLESRIFQQVEMWVSNPEKLSTLAEGFGDSDGIVLPENACDWEISY
jgi:hypothetical protein